MEETKRAIVVNEKVSDQNWHTSIVGMKQGELSHIIDPQNPRLYSVIEGKLRDQNQDGYMEFPTVLAEPEDSIMIPLVEWNQVEGDKLKTTAQHTGATGLPFQLNFPEKWFNQIQLKVDDGGNAKYMQIFNRDLKEGFENHPEMLLSISYFEDEAEWNSEDEISALDGEIYENYLLHRYQDGSIIVGGEGDKGVADNLKVSKEEVKKMIQTEIN
ncbi:hypothetical protein IC620_14875 [Hazenella sp. IB182357]|uniref:Uncharacterized protein n=1 Tax=Polycladospora coralii TaxID=2771432 RepID=A0A926NBN7_9BACL|nr:hypothetical protein [Polycladospora coralii]MBD1373628.1 hypothetical protein [Polycladospora coralii]